MRIERIFPFLWLKGEDKMLIAKEVETIYQSGLRAFCLESRVHPDFCGEGWFSDVEFSLQEAEKRNMQVWILDDMQFPSGRANGIIENKYPNFRAWHIYTRFVDIAGYVRNAKIPVGLREDLNERLIGAFIAKRKNNEVVYSSLQNIENKIKDGCVQTEIPYGSYRIYFVFVGQAYTWLDNYIDMMNPLSASKIIESVYQPHFDRLGKYFGHTLVGFFSDEPCLCNGIQDKILFQQPTMFGGLGHEGICYPYYDGIEKDIVLNDTREWISLWTKGDPDFRCRYMNAVTKRYAQNFNCALSKWCHEHGVMYTGHIIEDSGAHLRTICSAGHYFRSVEGADMSGVDAVLHQIKPYDLENKHFARIATYRYANPTFFYYTLAKLASSSANLDPQKKGRALCEVFGAYGWGESTKEMLYIANHFLSRGINYFVPHAFTPTENNEDCPPHFGGEKNPARKGYAKLFGYMNTLSERFDGGTSLPDVAVFYHDEAEWSGKPHEPCDVVAKALTQNQIEFDFVYTDMLENARLTEEGVQIYNRFYKYVIVPPCTFLTKMTIMRLKKIASCVIFLGYTPTEEFGIRLKKNILCSYLFANGVDRKTVAPCKGLRIYKYRKNDKDTIMLFNESGKRISFVLAGDKTLYAYDYASNIPYLFKAGERIYLQPGQAVIAGEQERALYREIPSLTKNVESVEVYLRANDEVSFHLYKQVNLPFDINKEIPDFCGEVRYKFVVQTKVLSLNYDGEFCEIESDGVISCSIGGSSMVFLPKTTGETCIFATLSNNLSYKNFDELSSFYYKPAVCLYEVKTQK